MKIGATIDPATTEMLGMRSSSDTPGIGSPVANVIQSTVDGVGETAAEMACGLAGRLTVLLANWHAIGGSGVGVRTGEPGGAAVGAGATGRVSAGMAGVAVNP